MNFHRDSTYAAAPASISINTTGRGCMTADDFGADPIGCLRISGLWALHAAHDARGTLSARTVLTLKHESIRLTDWTGKEFVGELHGSDLLAFAFRLEESGASLSVRSQVLSVVSGMLSRASVRAEDKVLCERLHFCAGLVWGIRLKGLLPAQSEHGAAEPLSSMEIHRLMVELASPVTEALQPQLADSSFWFIAMALTCGAPHENLARARVDGLGFSSSGTFGLSVVGVDGSSKFWPMHAVVWGIGIQGYIKRLAKVDEQYLFPALAVGRRGWRNLNRLLISQRFRLARGNGRGYSLKGIQDTFRKSAVVTDPFNICPSNDAVYDGLFHFASPLGFLT